MKPLNELVPAWMEVFRIIPEFRTLRLTFTIVEPLNGLVPAWVKVFRISPEFRILRLTFFGKSASKC